MIYVMGTDPSGVVKIGTALNPMQRLKQIQAGHPEPLEVLLACEGDRATESYLHRYFAERRVSAREWFDFTDANAVDQVVAALQVHNVRSYEDKNGGIAHVFEPPIRVNRTPDGHLQPTPVDVLDEDCTQVRIFGPDQVGRYTLEFGDGEMPEGFGPELGYLFGAHFLGVAGLVSLRDQLTDEIDRVEKLHAEVGGELYRRQRDGSLMLVNHVGNPLSIEGAA